MTDINETRFTKKVVTTFYTLMLEKFTSVEHAESVLSITV